MPSIITVGGIFIPFFGGFMTKIEELYYQDELIGFIVEGHANYSIPGRDIVCAAITILTINTINSLCELAGVDPEVKENDAYIEYQIPGKVSIITHTLLKAAQIGYKSIAEQYPENVTFIERR